MKVTKFKEYLSGTLVGFCEIQLASGMGIRDLALHEKDGRKWVKYPAKQYTKEDGSTGWSNTIYFPDQAVHDRFQRQLRTAVDVYFKSQPGAAQQGEEEEIPW